MRLERTELPGFVVLNCSGEEEHRSIILPREGGDPREA